MKIFEEKANVDIVESALDNQHETIWRKVSLNQLRDGGFTSTHVKARIRTPVLTDDRNWATGVNVREGDPSGLIFPAHDLVGICVL